MSDPKLKKDREETYGKDEFVTRLQGQVEQDLGIKMSKEKIWNMVKSVVGTMCDMAVEKPLSLAGVVRCCVLVSGRSGKPLMRIKPSSKINSLIDEGKSVIAFYTKSDPADFEKLEETASIAEIDLLNENTAEKASEPVSEPVSEPATATAKAEKPAKPSKTAKVEKSDKEVKAEKASEPVSEPATATAKAEKPVDVENDELF